MQSPIDQSSATAAASVAASPIGSSPAIVATGSLPFPTTLGDTWVYRTTSGATSGKITSENKIASVTQVPSGQQVLMDSSVTDNGVTQTTHFSYVVQPNGQIALPLSQFTAGGSGATGFSYKVVSGGMYWPSAAELASGKAYHSTLTMAFTVAGKTQQVVAHITATGGGTQSVTVPAGTYSATVVNELETEQFDGVKVTTEIKDWLATGVGPVQTEVVNVEGGTQVIASKQELVSFVKG